MEIPVAMSSIIYDTQPLGGRSSIQFFTDETTESKGVAVDIPEADLLASLCRRWQFWQLLGEQIGFAGQPEYRLGVKQPFISDSNRKPGDIDLLFCNPEIPTDTVAIEVKRVKVRLGGNGMQKVTKLKDFEKGIPQANSLAEKGFSRIYLLMIAVVDGRAAVDASFVSRGVEGASLRVILQSPSWGALRDDVGIVYVEVVQTTSRPVEQTGMLCTAVLRQALPREQPGELSDRVRRFFIDTRSSFQPQS